MTQFANSSTHVLITGGSTGIGRGLAQRYHAAGAQVIVTGRNQESLDKLAVELPGIRTLVTDIGNADNRAELAKQMIEEVPDLNVIINNAGIQRTMNLRFALAGTPVRVVELIPPAVATGLAGQR